MAMNGDNHIADEFVILYCADFNCSESETDHDPETVISTADIDSWDLLSILAHESVKIKADRRRLIEGSSYFRVLLSGSFSESRLDFVAIRWNLESFFTILRFLFGCQVDISLDNFIPIHEAALFFGVETVLLKCEVWLNKVTLQEGLHSSELQLDGLVNIWKYALEHANESILQVCTGYLARNFTWASSCNSFVDVPYELLHSCVKHPELTVDSERHLCDAILLWLAANNEQPEGRDRGTVILKQIRTALLPLWFAAGKRRCCLFSEFADIALGAILRQAKHPCLTSKDISGDGDLTHLTFRLTRYTKKLDLSGCPQIKQALLLLPVLPSPCDAEILFLKSTEYSSSKHEYIGVDSQIVQVPGRRLTFESVQEVDISNCPMLHFEAAVDCFYKSFPSLRTLRAAYFLNFKIRKLYMLVQKCPLLSDIDLSVDISPVVLAKRHSGQTVNSEWQGASLSYMHRPLLSNIRKLTLEGRTNICDFDLHNISEFCSSLCYINLKGCTSVSDNGISALILKCKRIHSILACDTCFGQKSVFALRYGTPVPAPQSRKPSRLVVHKLQLLHIGGCTGINGMAISELLSGANNLRSLCLRGIQLVDDALYNFSGSSLEALTVSDTKVSWDALSHVFGRNPELRCLKARGCRHLLQEKGKIGEGTSSAFPQHQEVLYGLLNKSCNLEEIEIGWGFSYLSVEALKPAIRTLRTLTVGLGASLGEEGLMNLSGACPLLEKLILYFQLISDSAIINIMKSLSCLQVLALCYCFGDISSLSFKVSMPNLRKLRLERVAPWMTNEDLAILTRCCSNLVELSLVGCRLLNPESQDIISHGWPGLMSIHLEDCGTVTAYGVASILDCSALEDLMLRHTGPGIRFNFILYAASKLPMLRKLSLDICDAVDGDFDIPSFANRYFLSYVKIARCKLQKCSFDPHGVEACRTPVHKETLLLVWDSEKLTTTVVEERL